VDFEAVICRKKNIWIHIQENTLLSALVCLVFRIGRENRVTKTMHKFKTGL